jgi:transposase-like protein
MNENNSIYIPTRHFKEWNMQTVQYLLNVLNARSLAFRYVQKDKRITTDWIHNIMRYVDENNPTEEYVRIGVIGENKEIGWRLEN